ncbi:hypothetical protein D9Q98_009721 [Chlorella vulgaris]|uniref:DUF11 domain-containing protein n=1 Tax=Chlorella vulgaris TaxID=3077 RepID=A0A9D4TEX2_CHLVU|nr:hypothetical protein D9Q98_009721 [Chlorella vulgaris]
MTQKRTVFAVLALLAVAAAPLAEGSAFGEYIHMKKLPASGWQRSPSAALKRSAAAALHNNCGYLTQFIATTCSTHTANAQYSCCEAICSWNAAGCGCLPNRDALLRAIPTTNAPLPANMAPAALASSFCGFTAAQFYSSTTGKCAVPAGGSNKCPAAKPAIENKCPAPQNLAASRRANVAALIRNSYLPVRGSTSSIRTAISALVTQGFAMADGTGFQASSLSQVMKRLVGPRLTRTTPKATSVVKLLKGSTFRGRQLSFYFKVEGTDALGKRQTLPQTFQGVATFAPCGSRIKSLYIANAAGLEWGRSLTTLSPFGRSASLAFATGPAPLDPKAFHGRFLLANTPHNDTPVGSKVPAEPVTMAQIEAWLMNTLNKALASPKLQSAEFFVAGCSTPSTINNIQFCGKQESGSEPMTSAVGWYGSTVSATCNALCADGAWQEAADWVCSDACDESVQAACDSCNSGCSAGCSTCQAGVSAACSSCNAACCFGCEICYPGTPKECAPTCCGIPAVCIPSTPGYCQSTQLCPNGACDSTCDMSQCNGACNCGSACASACDTSVCPDCNLQCQSSCEDDLNAATVYYTLTLNNVTGLGSVRVTDVVYLGSTLSTSTSPPTATFSITFSIASATANGWVNANLSPSYGIPPVSQAAVKSVTDKVTTTNVVVVNHVCFNGTGSTRVNVTTGSEPSSTGLTIDTTTATTAAVSTATNTSAVLSGAMVAGTTVNSTTQAEIEAALQPYIDRAMASIYWPWLSCEGQATSAS